MSATLKHVPVEALENRVGQSIEALLDQMNETRTLMSRLYKIKPEASIGWAIDGLRNSMVELAAVKRELS